MKKGKLGLTLGVVMSVIGLVMTVFNSIETYNVVSGIWAPVKEDGSLTGPGLYIALLCVGAVLLVGGIVCIVISAKKKKK